MKPQSRYSPTEALLPIELCSEQTPGSRGNGRPGPGPSPRQTHGEVGSFLSSAGVGWGSARAVADVVALARTEVHAVDTPRRGHAHARARSRPYAIPVATHAGRRISSVLVPPTTRLRPLPARHETSHAPAARSHCNATPSPTRKQQPLPARSARPRLFFFLKLSTPPLLR